MSMPGLRALTWFVWAVIFGLLVGALTLIVINRVTIDLLVGTFYPIIMVSALAFASVGTLIARRHPSNPIGWLFCVMGVGFAAYVFANEYALRGVFLSPGSLPAARWVGYQTDWLLLGVGAGPIGLVFLLFPTGRPLSRRWGAVAWILGASLTVMALVWQIAPGKVDGFAGERFTSHGGPIVNPFGIAAAEDLFGVLGALLAVAVLASFVASVVALVVRLRRARGVERQQVRWLAYTGMASLTLPLLILPLIPVALVLGGEAFAEEVLGAVFWFGMTLVLALGIPAASGIGILRYRLYDLDVVVKKTVVFGALVAFGMLVYLAVVIGIGAAIGSTDNAGLTLAAAAIVAIAFQPLRTRARHLADRLVYGNRATPYEVLSEFSDRMSAAYSTEDVLPRMAQILGQGTGAQRARVWLRVESSLRPAASWPPEEALGGRPAVPLDELDNLPGGDRTFPVVHGEEVLGALTVVMPPAEPLTPSQERLTSDLASQARLVLRNVRLIEELRASRQRLVAAQDQERRRLERNIHDGAQQQLVALAVKLGLAESLAPREPERTVTLLGELKSDVSSALEDLRDLARGIYPPLLADQGLAAALQAQARKSALPVEVETDGVGRYPQEAEAAVYFSVLEALQNTAKYAAASKATVTLRAGDGSLSFEVSDDGRGFDPETTSYGTGLQGMADRLEAIGGSLSVRSGRGKGTTVGGSVPIGQDDGR